MRICPHLFVMAVEVAIVFARSKCYSCATDNMRSNFITKQRGPQRRIAEPRVFDNKCDSDLWIIKERSTDECEGPCFKWQQTLNNSGSSSSMIFRGCYEKMFDLMDPNTFRPPNHSFCTVGEAPLACLSDASVIEFSCWCDGDYCNYAYSNSLILLFVVVLLSLVLY